MIALLLGLALARPTLPAVELTCLDGQTKTLPADLGPRTLVFVSFTRAQSKELDTWRPKLQALTASEQVDWLSIPIAGELGRTTRWIVTAAMKGAYDDDAEAHTAPLFEDSDPFVASLALDDTESIVVAVVDSTGAVLWSHRGPMTDQALSDATAQLDAP